MRDRYLFVTGKIVEDKSVYDGGFAYGLVAKEDNFAFGGCGARLHAIECVGFCI